MYLNADLYPKYSTPLKKNSSLTRFITDHTVNSRNVTIKTYGTKQSYIEPKNITMVPSRRNLSSLGTTPTLRKERNKGWDHSPPVHMQRFVRHSSVTETQRRN